MQSSFTTIAPAIVRRFNFRRTERQVPRTALKHRAAANIATTSSSKLGYVVVPLFLSTCTFEQFFFFTFEHPYEYLSFSIPFSSLSSMLCSSKCPVILSRTCVIITNQFKNDYQISITKLTP